MDTGVVLGVLSAELVCNVAAAVLLMRHPAAGEPSITLPQVPMAA